MIHANTPVRLAAAATKARDNGARTPALVTMLRLHWFIRLRWIFLGLAILVLVLERALMPGVERPLAQLAVVLGTLAGANLCWTALSYALFRHFRESSIGEESSPGGGQVFANGQVAADLYLLTCILRFTGGAENPMAIFYLFHMAIVALLLARWQALLQGFWAIVLYAGLVIGEWRGWLAPHYSFLPNCPINLHTNAQFVFASLVVVVFGILGTLYFTLQIAMRLEKRDRELRRINAALQQSQTAIQDLQRRRSRFMQTAAHQLKSPLAVIQTLTELIRSNVVPLEAVHGTCDKIVRRCGEGIAQVSELLTLARVQEADPARHARSEANVRQVIAELCERYRPLARDKQIRLECNVADGAAERVRVDPQDLCDCIGNLIENGIKYTPGPGTVTVSVAVEPPHGRPGAVSITVADTGMGIQPDILQSADDAPDHAAVFDAFRRGNNALVAGIPGTGLGLSIVREIVEQAGGSIHVTSRPDEGSSFTITFPAGDGPAQEAPIRDTRASEIVIEPRRSDEATVGRATERAAGDSPTGG